MSELPLISGLAVLGLGLLFLEFFLPGIILGILGFASLLGSMYLFARDLPLGWSVLYAIFLVVCGIGVCRFSLLCLKRSRKETGLYHVNDQEGFLASTHADPSLIGKEGSVSTELKPAGHVIVDGKLYHATSQSGFLSKNTVIDVVDVKGAYLIVRGKT